jgi:aldehyde dehydrogenase (NAD+)
MYVEAIEKCKAEGGKFIIEGGILNGMVMKVVAMSKPCIAEVKPQFKIVQQETFAPILYLLKYKNVDEAIAIQNNVPQGLSSSIMTLNLREAEQFLSHAAVIAGSPM